MTEQAVIEVHHLSEIAETKKKIADIRDRITRMEEEAGITPVKEELYDLESLYKRQIALAVENKLFEEEHYHLINKGRVMTTIHPKEMFERYPDIFWKCVKVTKGKAEDLLLWMYEDQGQGRPSAKKSVSAVIEEISSKEQSGENYELVDLLEGV